MNISAEFTSSRSFSLQTLFSSISGADKKTAGVGNKVGAVTTASVELIYASRTEITLQVEEFDKAGEKAGLKVPETPGADFLSGYWGIEQTSGRIAEFVLNGAGNDAAKLRIGRDAIMQGFREAEEIWGGKLPDFSYKTIDAAVAAIDERLRQLDAPVVDIVV